jgi:aldehyde dehydrogenase
VEATCTIDGEQIAGAERASVLNPARQREVVGSYPVLTATDVDRAVIAAHAALPAWAAMSAVERAGVLHAAAATAASLDIPTLLTREQGKVGWEAQMEAFAFPTCVELFSAMAPTLDEPQILADDENGRVKLYRKPVGVVGATVAWNAPVWLAAGKFVPALIAGNTVVVKPSPVAPLSVLALISALSAALPPGVLNSVAGEDLVVGSALFGHPGVQMTSFTGGIGGGRAAAAAGASSFTRMLLELGGNDAAVVLDDQPITPELCADLVASSFAMAGQVCINIKRVYAPADKVAELADGMSAVLGHFVVGDGLDPVTTMGPVTTDAQYKRVTGLIESARAAGGTVVQGGTLTADESDGFFIRPAIVTGLDESHPLVAEEQFGPALPIQGYDSVEQAVEFANGTDYGLTASVWSPDIDRAEGVARRLEAGGSFINVHGMFGVNMAAPYGGVKLSGVGREYGAIGFNSYTEPHVVSSWRAPIPG